MADIVSKEKRSQMMSGIRAINTKPELAIRKALHRLGYRYKLHDWSLPGKPDLVFPRYKAVIEIHGCFWHGHGCSLFKQPSSNVEFWNQKIRSNQIRDKKNAESLQKLGWRVLIVWECAIRGAKRKNLEEISNICSNWLRSKTKVAELSEK
jgi:DNA mismatch endonuclease (patch repair protein)